MSDHPCRVRAVQPPVELFERHAFVDIETTGLDPSADEIIEIGAVFVERGEIVRRQRWLVQPGRPIPPLITALTGLGDDAVAGAPLLEVVGPQVRAALAGWTLVAHNAAFERAFLEELVEGAAFVDSCELAHLLFPELPSHSLDSLLKWTGLGEGARHRALDDAEDTFLVTRALLREAAGSRGAELSALLGHLRDATSADRQALITLLSRASALPAAGTHLPPPRPARVPDEQLVARLESWLAADTPIAADVERADVLDAALAAAARVGASAGSVTVALPSSMLRRLRPSVPVLPRRCVCSTRLRSLLSAPGPTESAQAARAYLDAWSRRSTTGDPQTTSGWFAERFPEVRELLHLARECRCDDEQCFAHAAERLSNSPVVLVSHELALDWLERGAPLTLLCLDAGELPDAERRRSSVAVSPERLTRAARLGAAISLPALTELLERAAGELSPALDEALAVSPLVDQRARATPTWLRLRDVILGANKDVGRLLADAGADAAVSAELRELSSTLARIVEPPPPGFETVIVPGALVQRPAAPAETVAGRLRARQVLLGAERGATSWSRLRAEHVPPIAPPLVDLEAEPVDVEQLARRAARAADASDSLAVVVSGVDLAAVCTALRSVAPSLRVRTLVGPGRFQRGRGVVLTEWSRSIELPAAASVLVYGVRHPRRAALAAAAHTHVSIMSPTGLDPATLSALEDLQRPTVRARDAQ